MDKSNKTFKLAITGVLIALGTILSVIKLYQLPFGGSVTAFSMLPLLMLGYMYGIRHGVLAGLVYGIVQLILGIGGGAFAAQGAVYIILIGALDYILAYTAVGMSGIFKKRIKNTATGFTLGALTAMIIRFCCHVLSGMLFFGSWAEWYFTQEGFPAWGAAITEKFGGEMLSFIYSVVYNGSFMLPEIIITLIAGAIIANVKPIRKYLK